MIDTERDKNKLQYLLLFIGKAFVVSVFCFAILLSIIFFIYFGDLLINLNSKKSPIFNGYVIVSESMIPTININDAVVVKRVDNDKYKVGDIISFSSNDINYRGLIVTHRIINKENITTSNSIYTTKGDNNLVADRASVLTNQIYGKVLFIIPKLGYIKNFFNKPSNAFLTFFVAISFVIIYDGIKISNILVKRKN